MPVSVAPYLALTSDDIVSNRLFRAADLAARDGDWLKYGSKTSEREEKVWRELSWKGGEGVRLSLCVCNHGECIECYYRRKKALPVHV